MTVELWRCSDLDVDACIFYRDVPIQTFNILFESTQNREQYGTKITCTAVRKVMEITKMLNFLVIVTNIEPFTMCSMAQFL